MLKKTINPKFVIRSQPKASSRLDPGVDGLHNGMQASHPDAPMRSGASLNAVLGGSPLAEVLSGPLGQLAVQGLRVHPRQTRSVRSVERILSAAAAMALRQKGAENLSIEKIAGAAGVTPQAAYRYFKDADELVKTVLRCIVIREHERVVSLLSDRVLSDETEMAMAVVGIVLDSCERLYGFPDYLQRSILQEHRQIGYDASLLLAEMLCKGADVLDVRHTLDVVKVSVALMATIAVATSSVSRKASPLRGSRLEDTLTSLFVTVLRSVGRSSDAFCEMGSELDLCWGEEG